MEDLRGEICPVIKDYCTACVLVNGETHCEITGGKIHKGDECCDDVDTTEELYE